MAIAEALEVLPFESGSYLRSYSAARPSSAQRSAERETLRSALSSQYIRQLQRLENLIEQMKQLRFLRENWDSYGAMPPSDAAMGAASRFLFSCVSADALPIRVLPSAEGGIALRFVTEDKRALVEFLNAGSIEVMLYDEAGALAPEPEEVIDPDKIASIIKAHLTR